MHGVKKAKKATTEAALKLAAEKLASRTEKAAKYGAIISGIRQRRAARLHDTMTLGMIAKVLELNPEYYSLWNFRKEILSEMLARDGSAAADGAAVMVEGGAAESGAAPADTPEALAAIRAEELRLTLAAITRQPKSYAAWYHRRWVVARGGCDLAHEVKLCSRFLEADERNFHCWSYRRAVLALMLHGSDHDAAVEAAAAAGAGTAPAVVQAASEFAFTSTKLEQNFSNYSAFHHRSTLLRDAAAANVGATWMELVGTELDVVQQAVFTEPDDQSAWMYFSWLLHGVAALSPAGKASLRLRAATGGELEVPSLGERCALLREQLEVMQELLGEEEGCKWALLTASTIQSLVAQLCSADDAEAAATLREDCVANLHALAEVDPDHREYYAHRQAQITAEAE